MASGMLTYRFVRRPVDLLAFRRLEGDVQHDGHGPVLTEDIRSIVLQAKVQMTRSAGNIRRNTDDIRSLRIAETWDQQGTRQHDIGHTYDSHGPFDGE